MSEPRTLIVNTYKHAAWGSERPENARELARLHELTVQQGKPDLLAKVESARRNGEKAHELSCQLLAKLKAEGDTPEVKAWLIRQRECAHRMIATTLAITYERWQQHQQHRAERHQAQVYRSQLPIPDFVDGHHPNNLRYLSPSKSWQLLIDETGSEFASERVTFSDQDRRLGKVVGLALPVGLHLPRLSVGFHAVHESPELVDRCVADLLSSSIGIFGFSVKDDASRHHYWLGHVTQLVRWMLLMLPLESGAETRVETLVEQRGALTSDSDLEPLARLIEGELKAFDPERYAGLRLEMHIIGKSDHPANGYVDALACTWGGSLAVNEDRLKRSRLLGHCLLQPRDEAALERLYLAAVEAHRLSGEDWLSLCEVVADGLDEGVLGLALARFGQRVSREPSRWQALLQEVRYRQQVKNLNFRGMVSALEWLARYAPAGAHLGPRLELQLESARLALANHHGRVSQERLQVLLALCQRLEDEESPAVCQALLRVAVSTTNTFEFAVMQPVVEAWLKKPVAQPGRLNHAKLHSTLGQLQAFQGQVELALASFTAGLDQLTLLSDTQEAQRERLQTETYRVMALAELPGHETEALTATLNLLETLTGQGNPLQMVRSLARGDGNARFAQHLLLRTLLAWPDTTRELADEYLSCADLWDTGSLHPWGLILAYRGWLHALREESGRARALFQEALAVCRQPEQGITLAWLGDVLEALAGSMGVLPEVSHSSGWPQRLPAAPVLALVELEALPQGVTHAQRWAIFSRCLPYQFH